MRKGERRVTAESLHLANAAAALVSVLADRHPGNTGLLIARQQMHGVAAEFAALVTSSGNGNVGATAAPLLADDTGMAAGDRGE